MTLPNVQRGEKRYRSTGYLARVRNDRHPRTIARWIKDGLLPPADLVINGRRYWLDETLDAWDADRPNRGRA